MCNLDHLERAIGIIDHWSLGEGVLLYLVCVLGSQEVQGNSCDLQKIITTLHYFSLEMFPSPRMNGSGVRVLLGEMTQTGIFENQENLSPCHSFAPAEGCCQSGQQSFQLVHQWGFQVEMSIVLAYHIPSKHK